MDHRGREKAQRTAAERQFVPFLDHFRAGGEVHAFVELAEELDGLGGGDEGQRRPLVQRPDDEAGMVRLHMVGDKVVRRAAAQRLLQIRLPVVADGGVGSVQDGGLLVFDQIGIVGHSFRNGVLAFKQIQPEVVDPDIADPGNDVLYHNKVLVFMG